MSGAEQFRAKLESDPAFVQKVKGCADAAGVIQVAQGAGIQLTPAELAQSITGSPGELSDQELESVSVGTPMAAALIK